jgi:two-component system chemotaxis response regulator CheB
MTESHVPNHDHRSEKAAGAAKPLRSPAVAISGTAGNAANPGKKIRVLVVDDSVVIRRFVSRVLAEEPAFEVVGFAANGVAALAQDKLLHPDVFTMDIEMPELDGLATVRALRAQGSKAVIIMCSTLTTRGAASAIEALMLGANDYVTKPTGSNSTDAMLDTLRQELTPKIKQFFPSQIPGVSPLRPLPLPAPPHAPAMLPAVYQPASVHSRSSERSIVAIGVSTGGPTALLDLLPRLPAAFPVPIVIVQHMPPIFTRQLAERLDQVSAIEVLEATEGLALLPGRAILAPGNYHLGLKKQGQAITATLNQGERENSCRPAVDVLFRSVRALYGGRAVGVILTGMGQDGLQGTEALKREGAFIIAQDRASSVVWGMPGAVVEAGLANAVVGLQEIAAAILRQVMLV